MEMQTTQEGQSAEEQVWALQFGGNLFGGSTSSRLVKRTFRTSSEQPLTSPCVGSVGIVNMWELVSEIYTSPKNPNGTNICITAVHKSDNHGMLGRHSFKENSVES